MQRILNKITGLEFKGSDHTEDLLFLSRQDYKFLVPMNCLEDLLHFLKVDFFCNQFEEECIFHYHNIYFDTQDYKFFNLHRQGKYNRIKVRIRNYKNGKIGRYLECKSKYRGTFTIKQRQRLKGKSDNIHQLKSNILTENLKRYNLTAKDLVNKVETSYNRIRLTAKGGDTRISIDFDLEAGLNDQKMQHITPNHLILEVKSNKFPKKIIRFLKSELGIRETNFSKYCVSLCKLNDTLKHNKWKQILKHYCQVD